MDTRDVAIVGAGPVGLALACLLARSGASVNVFERSASPSTASRAIGIHPPGLAVLDTIGVGDAVRESAFHIEHATAEFGGEVLASLDLTGGGTVEPVLTLPQETTVTLLSERLEQLQPGALRLGVAIDDVENASDVARFAARAAPAGDSEADPTDAATLSVFAPESARVLVAADGVHSATRDTLGIRWLRRPGEATYVMVDIPDDGREGHGARLRFERGGVVESFPLPGEMRRWVALDSESRGTASPAPDGHEQHDPAARTAALVEARTGIHLDVTAPTMASRFTARQHVAENLVSGRTVLVGDAAHEVSPLGGQGMNLGWIGARRLATSILTSLATGEPAFADYGVRMRAAASRAHRRALFNMTMGRPASGPRVAARNAAIRALGAGFFDPVLRRIFTVRGL